MKRTGWLLAGAGVVVFGTGGLAGAAWWTGSRAEEGFRARAEALSADPAMSVTMTVVSYDRGLRNSTAVSRVSPRGMPEMFLELEHQIAHGPHPDYGWGRIETRLRGPDQVKAALDGLFGGQAAITIASTMPFEGGSVTEIVSPPFERTTNGVRSAWGGLTATLKLSAAQVATFTLKSPGLTVQGLGSLLTMGAISGDGEWNLSGPNSLYWTGRSALRMETAEASGAFGRYSVRGLGIEGWQKDEGATLGSGFKMVLASVTKAAEAASEPVLNDMVVEVDAERLDRAALSQFMHASEALQSSGPATAEESRRMLGTLTKLADDLAARSPRLNLRQLALKSPRGALRAQGHMELKPAASAAGGAPDEAAVGAALGSLGERLSGSAVVDISPELLRFVLEKRAAVPAWTAQSQTGQPMDEAAAAQLAARMAEARLRELVEAGLLRAAGEWLRVEAALEGGELRLNGLTAAEFMAVVASPGAQPASSQ